MSVSPHMRYSPEEYLEMDRRAERRSEYVNGEILAMAGASREHILIVTNLVRLLSTRLMGTPCETYSNDMRVKVNPAGNYTYPDLVVACGEIQFEDAHLDTLLNPLIIMEVLSPTTELKDRGEKFLQSQWIASLTDYLLVSQERMLIEQFTRQPDGHWSYSTLSRPEDLLVLLTLQCELPLSAIYDRVRLAAPTQEP